MFGKTFHRLGSHGDAKGENIHSFHSGLKTIEHVSVHIFRHKRLVGELVTGTAVWNNERIISAAVGSKIELDGRSAFAKFQCGYRAGVSEQRVNVSNASFGIPAHQKHFTNGAAGEQGHGVTKSINPTRTTKREVCRITLFGKSQPFLQNTGRCGKDVIGVLGHENNRIYFLFIPAQVGNQFLGSRATKVPSRVFFRYTMVLHTCRADERRGTVLAGIHHLIGENIFGNARRKTGDPHILKAEIGHYSLLFTISNNSPIVFAAFMSSPFRVTSYSSSTIAMTERAIKELHSSNSRNWVSALNSSTGVSSN